MAGFKTIFAAAVLTLGLAGGSLAQAQKSPDEGFETSKGAARQTNVDKGRSPSPAMGKKMGMKKMGMKKKMKSKKMMSSRKKMMMKPKGGAANSSENPN